MKRWLSCIMVLLVTSILAAFSASAEASWRYRLDGTNLAHILEYRGGASSVTLPATVDGYPVVGVDSGAIPDSVATLCAPALVTDWQPGAVSASTKVKAAHGTAALNYARQNGLSWESLSKLDFSEGVVDLLADKVSWTRKGALFTFPLAYTGVIRSGSLFYVPPESNREMGCVYEARSVEVSGAHLIVSAREATADVAYDTFSVHMENLMPDYANMQILSGAVVDVDYRPAVNTAKIVLDNGGVIMRAADSNMSAKTSCFKLELPLKNNKKATIQIELQLSLKEFDVKLKNHFGAVESARMMVNAASRVQLIGSTEARIGEEPETLLKGNVLSGLNVAMIEGSASSDTIELARIPFMTTGGFTFCVVPRLGIGLNGQLSVSIDSSLDAGFAYDGEWHNLSKLHEPKLTTEVAADFSARLEMGFTASLPMVPDVAELTIVPIEVEGEANMTMSTTTNATRACIDLSLEGHAKVAVGLGLKNAIAKYKKWAKADDSADLPDLWLSATLVNANIFEKSLHYEPGIGVVEKCTRDGVKVIFDANGGEGGKEVYFTPNTQIVFPYVTRNGHYLEDWLDEKGEIVDTRDAVMGTEERRFYAKWKEGEAVDVQPFTYGDDFIYVLEGYGVVDNGYYKTYNSSTTGQNYEHCLRVKAHTPDAGAALIAMANAKVKSTVNNGKVEYVHEGCFKTKDSTGDSGPYYWHFTTDEPAPHYKLLCEEGECLKDLQSIHYNSDFLETWGNSSCPNLKTVTFTEGIINVGRYINCISLESMSIPNSVEILYESIFLGCVSLQSVTLPNRLKNIPASSFRNCVSLAEINIPDTVEIIEGYAFKNCTSLKSITIPESVKSIGSGAFMNCTSLTRVVLPQSLEYISEDAFVGCTALERINLPVNPSAFPDLRHCPALKQIDLPPDKTFRGTDVNLLMEKYPLLKDFNVVADNDITVSFQSSEKVGTVSLVAGNDIHFGGNGGGMPERLNIQAGGDVVLGDMKSGPLKELHVRARNMNYYQYEVVLSTEADALNIDLDLSGEYIPKIRVSNCPNMLSLDIQCTGTIADLYIHDNPAMETLSGNIIHDMKMLKNCPALSTFDIKAMTGSFDLISPIMNVQALETLTIPDGCTEIINDFTAQTTLSWLVVPASVQRITFKDYSSYEHPPVLVAPKNSPAAEKYPEFMIGAYRLELRSEYGLEKTMHMEAGSHIPKLPMDSMLSIQNGLSVWDYDLYEDAACTERLDRNSFVMPAQDTVLYVKWLLEMPSGDVWHQGEFETIEGWEIGNIRTKLGGELPIYKLNEYNICECIETDLFGDTARIVIIPASLRGVRTGAFRSASALEQIVVQPDNPYFYSLNGALYDRKDTLLAVPHVAWDLDFVIPEGTKAIADYAFGWAGCPSPYQSVTIPDSVTEIGEHAFDGLSGSVRILCSGNSVAQSAAAMAGLSANPSFVLFMAKGEAWSTYSVSAGSELPGVSAPECPGQSFAGWGETENGPAVTQSYRVPEGGVVLYALWEGSEGIAINADAFPDATFRDYISKEFDEDGDGKLSAEEIETVHTIWLDNNELTSVKGVEYFHALEWLNCSESQVASIDISNNPQLRGLYIDETLISSLDLHKNPKLEELFCQKNPNLTALNLSANTALRKLEAWECALTSLELGANECLEEVCCNGNGLSTLDVSRCPNLRVLECSDNQLGSLDLSDNARLEHVACESNGLLSLTLAVHENLDTIIADDNTLEAIDVTGCPALRQLRVSDNALTSINVTLNERLDYLVIGGNHLTSLDISHNPKLFELGCWDNELTGLNIKNNPELAELACGANALGELDLSGNPALAWLDCRDAGLTSLDVSKNPVLTDLECQENSIVTLDISNCPMLMELVNSVEPFVDGEGDLRYQRDDVEEHNVLRLIIPVTTELICNATPHTGLMISPQNFADFQFRQYIVLNADTDQDGFLSDEELVAVKEINVDSLHIRTLTGIECFTELESLRCCDNSLTALPIADNQNLNTLVCYGNDLGELDLSANSALTMVDCAGCNLQALNVSGNTALKRLECDDNELRELDITHNALLEVLYCFGNHLSTLNLSNNTRLKTVYCHRNDLMELNVSACIDLNALVCSQNDLVTLDVSGNARLGLLVCFDNSIESLDVSKNPVLYDLCCNGNPLGELDIRSCPELLRSLSRDCYEEDDSVCSYHREFGEEAYSHLQFENGIHLIVADVNSDNTLTLPTGMKSIEKEAFVGIGALAVVVPSGCQSIGPRAFANSGDMFEITVPKGISIADDAFEGSGYVYIHWQ